MAMGGGGSGRGTLPRRAWKVEGWEIVDVHMHGRAGHGEARARGVGAEVPMDRARAVTPTSGNSQLDGESPAHVTEHHLRPHPSVS